MTVYTIANSKGGVGKTALAAEFVWRLAHRGRRVLAVDIDQQGNLGARLGIDADVELRGTLSDVLRGDKTIAAAATPSPHHDGILVLHGTSDLKDLETTVSDLATALRDTLPEFVDEHTDVVIDSPGDIGTFLLCALAAADVLVVSCATQLESLEQVEVVQGEAVDVVARRMNRGLKIDWIVPNRYDKDVADQRQCYAELVDTYGGIVTEPMPEYSTVATAYRYGAPTSLYRPKSNAAVAYARILDTILGKENPR